MFDYISGQLTALSQNACVVDTHGIGWSFIISSKSAARFSGKKDIKVYAYLNVGSSDRMSMEIYGFATEQEREFFTLLIAISGIGPKAAISILSALDPDELSMCVLAGDAKALTVANGIGMKGAQKIILELKDKIGKATTLSASKTVGSITAPSSEISEAVNALVVLGYSPQTAANAVKQVSADAKDLQDLIRLALKSIGV